MAERKDRMALLSRYNKLHLVESYGIGICYDLLDYYFNIASSPSWNYFAYNAEKILEAKLEVEQDIKERQERRKLARRWISE
jgi:hypothetical protein